MKESLPEVIKLTRLMNGMSQRGLAKKIGVSESFISLIERGKRGTSIEVIQRILDGLDVGLDIEDSIEVALRNRIIHIARRD